MTQAPLELAERVIALLEQARARLVRSVNSGMMITYWSIGREIVQALQGGEERSEYGKEVINTLSQQLTERYGKGYSAQTLWNFRQFYLTYPDRLEILSPTGRELIPLANLSLSGDAMEPIHLLKSPMVLEFLDLPDTPRLHESHLEQAIIDNLQAFLLKLGKGFSFVARQKFIRFDDDEFYKVEGDNLEV